MNQLRKIVDVILMLLFALLIIILVFMVMPKKTTQKHKEAQQNPPVIVFDTFRYNEPINYEITTLKELDESSIKLTLYSETNKLEIKDGYKFYTYLHGSVYKYEFKITSTDTIVYSAVKYY